MKDSYSLDVSPEGLDVQFEAHRGAYDRIFARMGLESIQVEASSGNMGGSDSVEFVVRSDTGEDRVALCASCGYAANLERAVSAPDEVPDDPWEGPPEPFPTPGVRTIAALTAMGRFAAARRQIKTLAYYVGDEFTLLALRGDHDLEVQKLVDAVAGVARPATAEEIVAKLGAHPGSLGAVGVEYPVIADPVLRGRSNMVTGAATATINRMPVLLERSAWDAWLDPANDGIDMLSAMCAPAAEGILRSHQVGRAVGNVRNSDASLVEPADPTEAAPDRLF